MPLPTSPTSAWRETQISSRHFNNLRAVTDGSGALHVLASTEADGEGIFHLSVTNGAWLEHELTTPPENGSDNSLLVATDVDGSIWVSFARWSPWNPCTFECPRPRSRFDRRYVMHNVGGTWSDPVPVPGVGEDADMAVNNGVVEFSHVRSGGGTASVYMTSGPFDSPVRWETQLIATEANDSHIAIEPSGFTWISVFNFDGSTSLVFPSHEVLVSEPISSVEGEEARTLDLFVDSSSRPGVTFKRYEPGVGYTTNVTWRNPDGTWSAAEKIAPDIVDDSALASAGSLHSVYAVFETDGDDGLWYSRFGPGGLDTMRVSESVRVVVDAAGAPQSIAVDQAGRPHIVFAKGFEEEGNGLFYMFGEP
jgi:hypothetical protein